MIIKLLRPIIFAWLGSEEVKQLVIDLMTAYAESTETEIDDKIVEFVRKGLGK